jgi:hypothetical protein
VPRSSAFKGHREVIAKTNPFFYNCNLMKWYLESTNQLFNQSTHPLIGTSANRDMHFAFIPNSLPHRDLIGTL